ncbi:MAG: hypothetical protein RLZZ31_452 [Actinomycetota bacterium]|jgi:hypothetical protein
MKRRYFGAILFVALLAIGCSTTTDNQSRSASSQSTQSTSSTSTTTSTSSTTTTVVPTTTTAPLSQSSRDRLAVLTVNDRPDIRGTYDRADWPHWADTDGNGCDARQDALIRWSKVNATVNRSGGCRVVTGLWVSPYDGVQTNNPSDFDIDHMVPLENAFRSGGSFWETPQRRQFANDQENLIATSASSNRSKGSKAPNEWRPALRQSWCTYADTWIAIKVKYRLSVTTGERDALGQMLDTCVFGSTWPQDGITTSPQATPAPTPAPSPAPGEVYYANCTAARAAGAAPIYEGQPGYRLQLDGDKDGVACE